MPGLSKVIVLDPDVRAGRQVQLGFQREGVPAEIAAVPREPAELKLPEGDAGLVIVGGADPHALELVRSARRRLGEADLDTPIVFAGRGVRRTDAEAAGADEVLLPPTYLRDVVTIGRLLRGQPAAGRAHLVGSLVETTGVLTLVRALAALGRSAVLTLIRGLRRGEIRFYHGEVTSAHVGLIHGQAALHQLLLWTDARFDFHHEDIVRRHQIPLERDELYADAERFLAGVRESSGKLSPSMVLEQDHARLQLLDKEIPAEVHGLLRMFDGHRVLADVLEDSPYRLFETLRVAQLAVEAGLLRPATAPPPRATWRAVLAIEEWLVGADGGEDAAPRAAAGGDSGAVPRAAADGPSGPTKSGPNRSKGSRRKRKKKRANTPVTATAAAAAPKPDIDWGALVPRVAAAEVGPLACVVPAAHASGEIMLPAQEQAAEPVAAEADDGVFPTETVFWDDTAGRDGAPAEPTARPDGGAEVAREAAEQETRPLRISTGRKPLERTPEPAAAAPEPAAAAPEPAAAAPEPAITTPEPAAAAPEPAASSSDPPPAAAETPDERARRDADETAQLEAMYRAEAEAAERVQAQAEPAQAEPAAATAEPAQAEPATATTEPAQAEPAAEEPSKPPAEEPPAEKPPALQAEATPTERMPAVQTEALLAEVAAAAEPAPDPAAPTREQPPIVSGELITARDTDEPSILIEPGDEPPLPGPPTERMPAILVDPSVALAAGAPTEELADEPSDGVIRQAIFNAETAPAARRPPPPDIPEDDRPEDAIGEIVTKTGQRAAVEPPTLAEPSILVADPSILVADLANVHAAAAAVAAAPATASTPSIATPAAEQAIAEVTGDAADAFTDIEEDFFRAGAEKAARPPTNPGESFDDLDEGYRPVGFWDRLLGRKPKR